MVNPPIVQVTLCDPNALWVEKESATDEYDLRSSTDLVVNPGCTALVPTGIELGLPKGIFGVISSASEAVDVVSTQVNGGAAPRAILVKVRNSSKRAGLHVRTGEVIAFVRLFMEYKVHVNAKPFRPDPTPTFEGPPTSPPLPEQLLTPDEDLTGPFNEFSPFSPNGRARLPVFEQIAPS